MRTNQEQSRRSELNYLHSTLPTKVCAVHILRQGKDQVSSLKEQGLSSVWKVDSGKKILVSNSFDAKPVPYMLSLLYIYRDLKEIFTALKPILYTT